MLALWDKRVCVSKDICRSSNCLTVDHAGGARDLLLVALGAGVNYSSKDLTYSSNKNKDWYLYETLAKVQKP